MIITHKLEMDLTDRETVQSIDVVQGDSNTRVLELKLLSGGESWSVPEGAAVWMRYCKSDGTKGIYDTLPDGTAACRVSGDSVSVVLVPQMLTAAGVVLAQVVFADGTTELATFSVQIYVERNPAVGAVDSEDYSNMLQWMEGELDRLLLQAKESGLFDGAQGIQGIPGVQGEAGQDVFDYAVEAGYTGEEEAFRQMLITPCLPLSGGIMTGTVSMGGNTLKGLPIPSGNSDAANKIYVDQKLLRAYVTLKADSWGSEAPYKQGVNIPLLVPDDCPRIYTGYSGVTESDRALKAAMDCIDYVVPHRGTLVVYCLEKKPETDFTLCVEALR